MSNDEQFKNAFIPKKLFTTFIVENKQEQNILGFMSPAGTDTAAKKRYETQMDWAYYSYRSDYIYKIVNGEYIFYHRDDKNTPITLPENLQPKEIDNEILSGYKIAKSVRRHYWGGGNVVWRIEDPRGFELEITSANMAKILTESTIEQGEIKDPCIWTRMGAQNLLVPVNTSLYQHIVEHTEKKNNIGKITLRDIKIGNKVEVFKQEGILTYYGPLNVVYSDINSRFCIFNKKK
jgi:hypothetical protein